MTKKETLKLFEERKVRTVWDDEKEKWYFSIVDVVSVLTDSVDATAYWRKLKQRLKEEGNETVTNCHGLKMKATDGKMRLTDVADTEQLLRIIQSIPSPKAEPFKQWMAHVASERLDQMQDPELSIEQAMMDYKRLGYSDNWINQRLKSIEIRKDLTDQWKLHNVEEGVQYATLTDIIYQQWTGKSAKEYKQFKGLKKENLRDNMTNEELVLNMLAELSTTSITKAKNPQTLGENMQCAADGGDVARVACEQLEQKTGREVVTPLSAKRFLKVRSRKIYWKTRKTMNDMEYTDKEYCLEVWGDWACFTRPELKVERVSYDVITPSAARAIFEAILFKRYAMRWQITKIEVLRPIKWATIRRNEVGAVASKSPIIIEDKRQQKNTLLLLDVRYRIYAKLVFIPVKDRPKEAFAKHQPSADENPMKYYQMFERRASQGQCFTQPYLGCREFSANWKYIESTDNLDYPLAEDRDFGIMLYDMDFEENPQKPNAMFYRAQMKKGVIVVPDKDSEEVLR